MIDGPRPAQAPLQPNQSARPPLLLQALLLASLVLLGSCASKKEVPRPRTVAPVLRDVPSSLRGTVGAEVTVNGIQPVLVSGLGFVVGLNGTGGLTLDDRVMSTMERELGLRGISRGETGSGTAIDGVSPRQLLADKNTAVVVVYAAIPPGAPKNATFDVYVSALNATSLEGGQLWTTELRIGEPTTFGGYQTQRLASAKGPIFVNPFAEPGTVITAPGQATGRVINGGIADSPMQLQLVLDNESSARARSIVSAINTRFPPGSHGQTARGMNASSISVTVPPQFAQRSSDFLQLLVHLPIDQSSLEAYAQSYVRVLRNEPSMAESMQWCLRAIGERAIPFVRELYDDADIVPRMAGLTVGSALADSMAAEPLLKLAQSGPTSLRTRAIELLSTIDAGPTIDLALRKLLAEEELSIRVAAYESLALRAEASQINRFQRTSRGPVSVVSSSDAELQPEIIQVLSGSAIQGVERRIISRKFALDRVPGGAPMIYVTQQRAPRVVIFGDDPKLTDDNFVSIWSDRLMVATDTPGAEPRLYYRDYRSGRVTQANAPQNLASFVEFLGRVPTPREPSPGLALSYSEVVGALSQLQQQGMINAAFATERDNLMALLLDANRQALVEERPETASDAIETVFFEAPRDAPKKTAPAGPLGPPRPIPIVPPTPPTSGSGSGRG